VSARPPKTDERVVAEAPAGDVETPVVTEPSSEGEDSLFCPSGQAYGGQAVIEGVMMLGRTSWAIAVRRPSGGIARAVYPLEKLGSRHHWLRLPVIRGVVSMYESLTLGIKALGISANVGLEDPNAPDAGQDSVISDASKSAPGAPAEAEGAGADEQSPASVKKEEPAFGWKELLVTVLVAVAFAVGLFVVVPLFVVKYFEETFSNPFVFNLVEGVIRIVIFLLYILVISLLPDLRRVFMYHGAEHKVIHAYESCGRADAERAKAFSTLHPRCGTGFLLLVMVIAVFVFAIVGKPDLLWLVISRLLGIPLIIGVSYEIGIKWLGRHPNGFAARILLWPGLQLQRLTTRQPTPDQLEVAAAALAEVMRMDGTAQLVPRELTAQT
jgi:uncharacterized protein YqhQ